MLVEKKISIIVPVYNNEKYLERCILSLINQTYRNLEIILINDGSTDNSKIICEKYLKRDKRIVLINQKNSGVSAARNKGIEVATGEWIGFVDSDDWVKTDMYESLYRAAIDNNADISICGYIRTKKVCEVNEDNNNIIVLDDKLALVYLIEDKEKYATAVWNKLYKKNILENIIFNMNIKYGEDLLFNFNILINNKKNVVFNKDIKYYYFSNIDSATALKSFNKAIFTELDVYEIMLKEIMKKNYKFLEQIVCIKYQEAILRILLNLLKFDTKETRLLFHKTKEKYKRFLKINNLKDFIKIIIINLPYNFSRVVYKEISFIKNIGR